jgi:cell division protein FtsL
MITRRIKRNIKWILIKFSFFLYILLSIFALIWLRTAVVNLEYEIGELAEQKAELLSNSDLLIAERANFYSAKKIEDIAMKQLGMILPQRDNIFFVRRTGHIGPYKVLMEKGSIDTKMWKEQRK